MSPSRFKTRGFSAILLSALAAILPCFIACSPMYAGSGSDTEVSGRIITPDGKGVAGTCVLFVPSGFTPAFGGELLSGMVDTTDSNGSYLFTAIPTGDYNLQAVNQTSGLKLLRCGINVPSDFGSISVPPDSLKKTACLNFTVPDSILPLSGSVYVSGSTFFVAKGAGQASLVLDSIPQGTLPQIRFAAGAADPGVTLFSNVQVPDAGTVSLTPYPGWLHSAKILINTSRTGVLVPTIITDFNLALRLAPANFPFSQTLLGGGDIRFTKENGLPLPFEIAQWNTALSQAVIWVAMDTILPDNGTQYIRMFWGKADAQNTSDPHAVFDTGRGFAGVWHLEEEAAGVGTTGLYKDATPNAANGDDFVASAGQGGYLGSGCTFSDGDRIPTNGPVTDIAQGAMTICLWANFSVPGGVVFSKTRSGAMQDTGDEAFYFGDSLATGAAGLRPTYSGLRIGSIVAQRDMGPSQWHFYAIKRYLSPQGSPVTTFYIDGGFCGITNTFAPLASDDPNAALIIGSDGTRFFNGILDELSISKSARSDDWIMLSFENQRMDQGLVTIEIEK
jgi:hypothetical protein